MLKWRIVNLGRSERCAYLEMLEHFILVLNDPVPIILRATHAVGQTSKDDLRDLTVAV